VGELDKLVNGYDEWGNNKHMSLKGQLAKLRLTAEIEESIATLNTENVGVFAALDTWWLERDDNLAGVRSYDSMIMALIGFGAAKLKSLTISVTNDRPPTQFDDLYPRIKKVVIDDKVVWDRTDDDDIPF